jgi:hypothetical protein
MNAKDVLLSVYGMNERTLNAYLADLGDADLLLRPVAGQNHIAWQLGHLISSERFMLEAIKPGSSPALPDGFDQAHGRDPAATTSDDPGQFQTKDRYLQLWNAQREATKSVLSVLSDADLDAPAPERFRQNFPTVGGVFQLMGSHVLMHVGQFVSVRRKLGKPVAI